MEYGGFLAMMVSSPVMGLPPSPASKILSATRKVRRGRGRDVYQRTLLWDGRESLDFDWNWAEKPRKKSRIDSLMMSHLVGGLEQDFFFAHHIGNVIIPTDELNHFSEGWRKTTNQWPREASAELLQPIVSGSGVIWRNDKGMGKMTWWCWWWCWWQWW